MEPLSHITDVLKCIKTDGIKWIDLLEKPAFFHGILRLGSDAVDFVKFPMEAREEIQSYGDAVIREMDNLNANCSGGKIVFRTNSPRIIVKTQLKRKWSYKKMTLWNSHGFDVYGISEEGKYIHNTVFSPREGNNIFAEQINWHPGMGCIYLPTYNSIEYLEFGIEEDAYFEPCEIESRVPIVFYGHSVTQGAAASRPGNCFPNIVNRMMNREIINLSCSSACRGLLSMAELIGKLNVYGIVIDYTRNANSETELKNTHERFYRKLREFHPNKRIILMTSCNFSGVSMYSEFDNIVRETYQNACQRGENVKLLEVMQLFNDEDFSLIAVDGSHVNDLGMYRIAEALCKLLTEP